MKKIGRPEADNPKDVDIRVRIETDIHNELLEYCKKENITKAEAIRRGIRKLLGK